MKDRCLVRVINWMKKGSGRKEIMRMSVHIMFWIDEEVLWI